MYGAAGRGAGARLRVDDPCMVMKGGEWLIGELAYVAAVHPDGTYDVQVGEGASGYLLKKKPPREVLPAPNNAGLKAEQEWDKHPCSNCAVLFAAALLAALGTGTLLIGGALWWAHLGGGRVEATCHPTAAQVSYTDLTMTGWWCNVDFHATCDGASVTATAKRTSTDYNGPPHSYSDAKCLHDVGGAGGSVACWRSPGACDGWSFDDPAELHHRFTVILIVGAVLFAAGAVVAAARLVLLCYTYRAVWGAS